MEIIIIGVHNANSSVSWCQWYDNYLVCMSVSMSVSIKKSDRSIAHYHQLVSKKAAEEMARCGTLVTAALQPTLLKFNCRLLCNMTFNRLTTIVVTKGPTGIAVQLYCTPREQGDIISIRDTSCIFSVYLSSTSRYLLQ